MLKERYGKETSIQQAYLNHMLSLPPVYSDKDNPQLRRVYDRCEMHYRGLKALGVDENTYASVVPTVLQRLQAITRGEEFLEW